MDILKKLAEEFKIRENQVEATVGLIDEGNTIPFIARYRKEVTGALSDEVLRELGQRLEYLRNLQTRKEEVVIARRISMWLIKNSFDCSFEEIGKMFGNQSHSNVIISVQ